MKRLLLAISIVLILASGMIACGDSLTGPEKELVGSWTFVDTDMVTVFANRFEEYLVAQGMNPIQARTLINSAFSGAEANLRNRRSTVRFNEDNTWEDNHGNKGTWRIDGDKLTSTDDDGTTERTDYFLDGDDLTLIYTKAQFLEDLREDQNFDAEIYEFYNNILNEGDVIRIFYRRRS